MTTLPEPQAEAAKTTSQLADDARSNLTQLHRDVVLAEERVVETHAALLLEANEKLVVSTLRAQTDAETAARVLEEVSRSSVLDALTELPNRALLLERFALAAENAKRNQTRLALLFVDLDNFKQINDALGHSIGDQALKLAARCLASAIRGEDTVSRYGGDEFLILLSEVSKSSDAIMVAEKVVAALAVPSQIGEHVVHLRASIGISVYPDDGLDAETLIDRADAAMYLAKKHGVGSFAIHGQGSQPPQAG